MEGREQARAPAATPGLLPSKGCPMHPATVAILSALAWSLAAWVGAIVSMVNYPDEEGASPARSRRAGVINPPGRNG